MAASSTPVIKRILFGISRNEMRDFHTHMREADAFPTMVPAHLRANPPGITYAFDQRRKATGLLALRALLLRAHSSRAQSSLPPVITNQPPSLNAVEGQNVTFNVGVTGTGPFSGGRPFGQSLFYRL